MTAAELTAAAQAAAERALCPISGFKVGAVLLGESGALYSGSNAEWPGAPVTCTLHAETAALACARAAGERGVVALAVTASPCGGCRQLLAEWAPDAMVHFCGAQTKAAHLLPRSFDLGKSARPFPAPAPLGEFDHGEDAAHAARALAFAPYTGSAFGCALQDERGAFHIGATLESAAYNTGLSALHCAAAAWLAGGRSPVMHLWLCGDGPCDERPAAVAWAEAAGISWTVFDE